MRPSVGGRGGLLAICVAVASTAMAPRVAASTPSRPAITLEDVAAEVGLGEVAISPDGRGVVVVVSRPDFVDNRFVRSLWWIDAGNGDQRELTPGRGGVASPQWSPDGRYLAWLDTPREGVAQIHHRSMDGVRGETVAATSVAGGVNAFRWSPDGRTLAFLADDPPALRTGAERHNRSFDVGDNGYALKAAPDPAHLWIVSVEGGEARRLTSGPDSLKSLEWRRDGRAIAYVAWPRPQAGAWTEASLGIVDVDTGERRTLLRQEVGGAPVIDGFESLFPPSPDGGSLAFSRPRGPAPWFSPNGVFLLPLEGGPAVDATADIDRNIHGMAWMPDDGGMLVVAPDRTRTGLWRQPGQGAAQRLDTGDLARIGSPSMSRVGTFAFVASEARRGPELYVMRAGGRPKRLTRFNARYDALVLGQVSTISWTLDGFTQDGVLVYPPDFEPGRRYPLVLHVHGGPMGTSLEGFSGFDQWLAAQGWLVFSPNYRGSDSQGARFQTAVIDDAGDGPGRDVMAGVAAVKAMGIVDEDRVAVSGWSYGGFMTAWLTAHYPGWRAAVAGAAVTDWFDWYNLADVNRWAGHGLGGSPWRNGNAANYWRQSPMAHAHLIRTPTLILSNTGDERVPITQSYKLYHALKDNGVPVRFIAYPIDGHWPGDPVHQRDVYRQWMEWIARRFDP